jgi:hypothetical protein
MRNFPWFKFSVSLSLSLSLEPAQRKGRDCIHPQMSRTKTFGKIGSSVGQFFDKYLARIVLSTESIDWSKADFGHLRKVFSLFSFEVIYYLFLKSFLIKGCLDFFVNVACRSSNNNQC